MLKNPTVSVYLDLTEKKQSWLVRFWTRTHAITKELPGTEFLLRVKDSCKQAVRIFCVWICMN